MKSFTKPLRIFCYSMVILGMASTANAFDKTLFMKEGLADVEQSLESRVKDVLPADSSSCPQGGIEVRENLSSEQGKVFGAVDSVHSIMELTKPIANQMRQEQQRCGACQQTNVVSSYATVSPTQFAETVQCDNRKGEIFSMDLLSRDDIKNVTEQILQGSNSDGARLQAACPDPCSYYITTAETSLPNGKIHLTLNVQCGQPRQASILSAVYDFKAGLIHQWSCSK